MSKQKLRYIVFFAGVIAVLAVSNWFNFRVDLTADGNNISREMGDAIGRLDDCIKHIVKQNKAKFYKKH